MGWLTQFVILAQLSDSWWGAGHAPAEGREFFRRQPGPAFPAGLGVPILLKTLMGLFATRGFFGRLPSAKLPLSAGP
jgi:hypothetical protein